MFRKQFAFLVMFALLSACAAVQPQPTQDVSAEETRVAQYVQQTMAVNQVVETQVVATQAAAMTSTATNMPTATNTQLPPTATNTPLPTNTVAPTNTLPPAATNTPAVCNAAQFVADLTAANGTLYPANSTFTKVWRVRNVGSCTWTTDFRLVYDSGDKMDGSGHNLPKKVAPGQTVDISIPMKAPDTKGTYKGYWILKDKEGDKFGIGTGFNKPLEVVIKVPATALIYSYDFASNLCTATWKTDNGILPCNGSSGASYVQYNNGFKMESGKTEDESVIIVNVGKEDRVRGTYPDYVVQPGDRFVAQIGCVYDSPKCKVKLSVEYKIDGGGSGVLGEWVEKYDGQMTIINIDLSAFAGQEIHIILDAESKSDSSDNQIFWFVPSIRNP